MAEQVGVKAPGKPKTAIFFLALLPTVVQLEKLTVFGFLEIVAVISLVLLKVIDVTVGLRPTEQAEREGLDTTEHGEEGYIH